MASDRDPRKEVIGDGLANILSDKGLPAEPIPIVADEDDKLDNPPRGSLSITRGRLPEFAELVVGAISNVRIMERRVSNDSYRFISLERPMETFVPLRTSNKDTSFGLDLNYKPDVRTTCCHPESLSVTMFSSIATYFDCRSTSLAFKRFCSSIGSIQNSSTCSMGVVTNTRRMLVSRFAR